MANTTQYAFRLPREHIELLEAHAARLAARLGVPITRTDALKMLLEFAQKVERIREARIQSYAEQIGNLPPGPERDRAQQARDDWETMSYERILGFAEIQALASDAVRQIRRAGRAKGLDRISAEEIDAEIRAVRRSRSGRRRH